MKYTKEQRLDIGRRIYDGEITKYEAAEQYDISYQTARDYMRLYRNVNHLPPKRGRTATGGAHIRQDYPERSEACEFCSVCTYQNGEHRVSFEKEDEQ